MTKPKNPHAVALGRLGGSVKTAKGLATMTRKRRMEIVRMGNQRNHELALERRAQEAKDA
jgi:hypothetical protein